jgi:hypothetical protein
MKTAFTFFTGLFALILLGNSICVGNTCSPIPGCINPTSGGTIGSIQSICTGTAPISFTSSAAATGHTGTLEYKWQSSTTNSSSGFSDIGSSNSTTYTSGNLTVTTWFKRLARVTCTADWSGAASSNVITVTVSPTSVGGTISGGTTVATGTNSTTLTLSGHTGSVTTWKYSTDNWVTSTLVSNITSSLTAVNLTQSRKYRAIIKSGTCTEASSGDATITVVSISGGSVASDATVCGGANSTTLTLSGHTGNVIKWQSSTNNFLTSTDIANSTTTYTASNLNNTTAYRAVVGLGVAQDYSTSASITVLPESIGGTLVPTTAVCNGVKTTTLTLTGFQGTVKKWQYSIDDWSTMTEVITSTAEMFAVKLEVPTKYRVIVQNGTCPVDIAIEATVTP